jgi:flavorubredoxin
LNILKYREVILQKELKNRIGERNMKINKESLEKEPVNIANGIYWVGYTDPNRGLHCNPYLIIDDNEAVLIDGGNRDDFSNVMLKILRTGLKPSQIIRLIYQHYDPDLCGSLPQLEAIINNDALRVISHTDNNVFIHYYSQKTEKLDYRQLGSCFEFASGRRLEFYSVPYCHHSGTFITYDVKTRTLFTGDLFGSFDSRWTLILDLNEKCKECHDTSKCRLGASYCAVHGMIDFHQKIMTSNRAFMAALDTVERLNIDRIAPQHGSVISTKDDIKTVIRHLRAIENVGIDYLLSGGSV